ncbi:hypothetical protein B0E53_04901 [Micromonospora sp. MH33]|nr:hypothetical protein B0E53_04901 [Micromonospora sp. MH33]
MIFRRIDRTSSTASGRSAAVQTSGASASIHSRASARSPAAGRALSSAWNSQVRAQRR